MSHCVSAITVDDLSQARAELESVFAKTFGSTTFDADQRAQILDQCANGRKGFSMSSREWGTCKSMQATLPLQRRTVPIDKPPYRVPPHTQETTDKCAKDLEDDGIIERQASPYGSLVTIAASTMAVPGSLLTTVTL